MSGLVLTKMEPSWPWCRWNCTMAWNGKSQITSLLRTKKGSAVSESRSRARARGPAAEGNRSPSSWGSEPWIQAQRAPSRVGLTPFQP